MAGDDVPPPPSPKIESNSPYFLGPQDRLGDYITPTHFKGDNFDEWTTEIQTALEARCKFEFLDNTITEPQPPCTKSDWTAINAMLISWITNTIDVDVKSSFSKFREVKPFWDHLKRRFAQTNGPRVQQLRSSLAKCEQTKTMSVSVYYKKLHALRQELDHHEPLISCTCCSDCTVGHLHEVRREQSKLHDFLIGLYFEYYSSLWTNILSQDPLPSHDRAYHLVLQEERVRMAKHESETTPIEALGFAVRVTAGRGRGSANRPVCSHCKKIGHVTEKYWSFLVCSHCKKHSHDVSKFYDIIGYPKGWTEKSGRLSFAGQGRGLLHAIATPVAPPRLHP